jgi:hypothetical protein
VIAGDGERLPGGSHVHDDAQHVGRLGAAIDEIADEEGASSFRCRGDGAASIARAFEAQRVAQLAQQRDELVGKAVQFEVDLVGYL